LQHKHNTVYQSFDNRNGLCCENCLSNLRAKSRETALSQMWRAWRHATLNPLPLRHTSWTPCPLGAWRHLWM